MLAALRQAIGVLTEAGVATPRVDAELLLSHLLATSRGRLLLVDRLTAEQQAAFTELIGRRAAGQPVQHLTGSAPFRHLELAVGAGVFIPRPETELIVELAAAELAKASLVVDLCAGSGAIALAIAQEYPSVEVIAVERSAAALAWLARNATDRTTAGDHPITVLAADITEAGLLAARAGQVDLVLSNPPYVPERIRAELAAEIEHDPAEAVFAGPDGMALMPHLIVTARRLLRPGGRLIIEHDVSQPARVAELLSAGKDWMNVAGHADLAGRPRFTSAVLQ